MNVEKNTHEMYNGSYCLCISVFLSAGCRFPIPVQSVEWVFVWGVWDVISGLIHFLSYYLLQL